MVQFFFFTQLVHILVLLLFYLVFAISFTSQCEHKNAMFLMLCNCASVTHCPSCDLQLLIDLFQISPKQTGNTGRGRTVTRVLSIFTVIREMAPLCPFQSHKIRMNYEVNPSGIKYSGSFLQMVAFISFSYVLNLFCLSLSVPHLHIFVVYSKQFLVWSLALSSAGGSISTFNGDMEVDLDITNRFLQLLPSPLEHTQFLSLLHHLNCYLWLIWIVLRNCTRIRSLCPKLTSVSYNEFMS